ncbi:MAG: ABC transporter permease subunit [Actinobacteria bacterium]|nr:ABC transporter permease subunit [Actinomycetota bacterium]
MPIISEIGSRSLKVRLVYGTIFLVLSIGAVTMIYPLMLMLSGSVKSQTDIMKISPWPRYWFDELALFQKYTESKYNVSLPEIEKAWHRTVRIYDKIEEPVPCDPQLLESFLAWRQQWPWWTLGHAQGGSMLPENGREFRKLMSERFGGGPIGLKAFNTEMGMPLKSWSDVQPPVQGVFRYPRPRQGLVAAFLDFAEKQPVRDRIIPNLDGEFWKLYLVPKYTNDIEQYNQKHGTNYAGYDDVMLSERVPNGELQRADWEKFVRELLDFQFIRLSPELTESYRRFLASESKYASGIAEYNRKFNKTYASFDEIPFPTTLPADRMEQVDWGEFIKNRQFCPAEGIEVYGPRQAFEEYVAKQRGVPVEQVRPLRPPIAAADWNDCMANKSHYRWEFTTRNYKQVFDYILLHGRGIRNTLIYCSLAVGLALLVNPLAAYALSRYKPPSQYKILLICMATMAFPAAVTMIPAFLLLKRFPLWSLLGGGVGFAVAIWLISKFFKNLKESIRLVLSLGVGILVGVWLMPAVTGKPYVSLLNTFAALVLPGMVNGYSIFLLKGFFDSLPRELYEAADLDGASEWTKFWSFTMNLSKPILAVIALGAFTAAYSQFMMALIIIPDRNMWTLMVWIFQLQSTAHQAVVYASLVIGAIPTFLIFVFCQGIIMRGIVVPTEK